MKDVDNLIRSLSISNFLLKKRSKFGRKIKNNVVSAYFFNLFSIFFGKFIQISEITK